MSPHALLYQELQKSWGLCSSNLSHDLFILPLQTSSLLPDLDHMSIRLSSTRTSDSQMLWMICFSTHLGTFKLSINITVASPLPVTFVETMLIWLLPMFTMSRKPWYPNQPHQVMELRTHYLDHPRAEESSEEQESIVCVRGQQKRQRPVCLLPAESPPLLHLPQSIVPSMMNGILSTKLQNVVGPDAQVMTDLHSARNCPLSLCNTVWLEWYSLSKLKTTKGINTVLCQTKLMWRKCMVSIEGPCTMVFPQSFEKRDSFIPYCQVAKQGQVDCTIKVSWNWV